MVAASAKPSRRNVVCGGAGRAFMAGPAMAVERRAGGVAFALQCSIIVPAPTKAHLAKRRFTLLEDNDNAGNRSKEGRAAKSAGRMAVLEIPKHSPDLNVMDFAVWAKVEKRM